MGRFEHVTAVCNLQGKGLEIGPSYSPVCPKRAGFNCEILDHLDREGLRAKYKDNPYVNQYLDNIEEVDYIWNGEDYSQLIGKAGYYDYIIGCHMIEHTTDLISFLEQCSILLKDDGVLSLAVPHKYYEFDCYRECTGLARVLEVYPPPRQERKTFARSLNRSIHQCLADR